MSKPTKTKVRVKRKRKTIRLPSIGSVGASPGFAEITEIKTGETLIRATGYGAGGVQNPQLCQVEDLSELRKKFPVLWVEVLGLGDGSKLNRLAQTMAIHPLVMEDIMRPNQRAKFENYGQQNFFITQRLHGTALQFEMEQFALIWEPGLVISFRERDDESLKTIAQRLTKPGSRMAGSGSDYLVYALIDLVVDHCFPIFEGIGDALDQLEDEVLNDSKPTHTAQAHESRRHIQSLLHMVRPLRDACLQLTRNDHNQLSQVTQTYMRDCYEHCVQLLEILEVYREICQGIQEIYYAVQGQKLNENMRVLTVFASIFIPLTFITGIYGMNFDTSSPYNMPELSWKYGYFGLLGFLFTVTVLLLIYFSRRKWF